MSYTDQDFETMQARQALHPEGVSCQNCIHENNCDCAGNPDQLPRHNCLDFEEVSHG
jgi:hypothetical protein